MIQLTACYRLHQLGLVFLLSSTPARSLTSATSSSKSFPTALQHTAPLTSSSVNFYSNTRRSSSTFQPHRYILSSSSLNMMTTKISFDAANQEDIQTTMVVGKRHQLKKLALSEKLELADDETFTAILSAIKSSGAVSSFAGRHKIVLGCIPSSVTRHNHAWSVHEITDMVASNLPAGQIIRLIFVGDDALDYQGALALAVTRAFPVFSLKTKVSDNDDASTTSTGSEDSTTNSKDRSIYIEFWDSDGSTLIPTKESNQAALGAVEGAQLACRLVDMPPDRLTTDVYAQECKQLANELDLKLTEVVGQELQEQGYGGIYGVEKAATCPPRLIIMEYTPNDSSGVGSVALVGKAIVYDTGGLALKSKVGMCGMKGDMGGSAGVLGGFVAAVKSGYPHKLTLLLCIAENAIGPMAVRNDDVLTLYSGKTVEINNSDAEGRLVLGDGVAHATKHIDNLDLVVDMATLTGAQLVTTGKKHAGILANTADLETRAIAAGLKSGDLVYPLLYAPELLKKEFNSKVADMKNSVKDRSNAQSSCAGHFIESHLNPDYDGGWLHVDMAGPATNAERGTGYGVGLVMSLLKRPGF